MFSFIKSKYKFHFSFLLGIAIVVYGILDNNVDLLSKIWNVYGLGYCDYFGDLHAIIKANQEIGDGKDPYAGGVFNYPPLWFYFSKLFDLKLENKYYLAFGFTNLGLYVISFILLVKEFWRDRYTKRILFVLFFSYASILLIERGNTDMVMFFW